MKLKELVKIRGNYFKIMKIIKGYPPNYDKIAKRFDLSGKSVVFTYDGVLYDPSGGEIAPDLMVHEEVHARLQKVIGTVRWWERYLENDKFRLMQEIFAYRAQYQYAQDNYNRNDRRRLLQHISKDLSSDLYGKLITKEEAKEAITG